MIRAAFIVLLALTVAAMAEAPDTSLRPVARAVVPAIARTGPEARAEWFLSTMSLQAVPFSPRPTVRPPEILAMARRIDRERQRGAVCGDLEIQGDTIGNHPGPGSCGVEGAVRVRTVAGVRLSPSAIMDCRTAGALRRWVQDGARRAVADQGGGIAGLRVIGHYSCRTRSGGRLSEHAFGRAIDISAIKLRDGSEISVLRDWGSGARGRALREMHRAACGPFGTVLGPDANADHRDHFHFDTARYRSGSYCR
ncbi:extensin family protein [Octadecabacter sp. R77987]|uniref:extensin-like domain-containing protein n=1 Tax=Octadecabacter sp. R77987 TaxID=3093874 RepID=UPI00366EED24